MARIAFIILAHDNPENLAELARGLVGSGTGHHVVIHFDRNAPEAQFGRLSAAMASNPAIHLVADRIRCGWGDFTLVEATLLALRLIRDRGLACDRVMLVSGACLPIRPIAELSDYLDAHPQTEFIEVHGAEWIVAGMRQARYEHYHIFNKRKRPRLFFYFHVLQKWLGVKRAVPAGLAPRFGSQWWTLTWPVCARVLELLDADPRILRFFRTTWIPDELMLQTLVGHLVPDSAIAGHNLTFSQFDGTGQPLMFVDCDRDLLSEIPRFFARKIHPGAAGLRRHFLTLAGAPARMPVVELPAEWRIDPGRLGAGRQA